MSVGLNDLLVWLHCRRLASAVKHLSCRKKPDHDFHPATQIHHPETQLPAHVLGLTKSAAGLRLGSAVDFLISQLPIVVGIQVLKRILFGERGGNLVFLQDSVIIRVQHLKCLSRDSIADWLLSDRAVNNAVKMVGHGEFAGERFVTFNDSKIRSLTDNFDRGCTDSLRKSDFKRRSGCPVASCFASVELIDVVAVFINSLDRILCVAKKVRVHVIVSIE